MFLHHIRLGFRVIATAMLLLVAVCYAQAVASDPTAAGKSAAGAMQLTLEHGSTSTGQLQASSTEGFFAWQADGFAEPFEFDLRSLRFISPVDRDERLSTTSAANLFELSDGGLVAGDLVSIDDEFLVVDSPVVGKIALRRSSVLTIVDSQYAGKVVYTGPRDDGRWTSLSKRGDSSKWQYEAGQMVASGPGGTVVGDIGLPPKCRLQLALAWERGVPDFVLAVGTNRNSGQMRAEELISAATVEVWDDDLAIVRETRPPPPIGDEEPEDGESDFQMLTSLEKGARSLEFVLYIDQIAGRIIACDSHGRRLAEMVVPPKDDFIGSAIHISNTGASLSLVSIEAREWDGLTTQGSGEATAVLETGMVKAAVTGFDSSAKELILDSVDGPRRVKLADVRRAEFSASEGKAVAPQPQQDGEVATEKAAEFVGGEVELLLSDRSRLFGKLLPSAGDALTFHPSQSGSPVRVSLSSVIGLAGTPVAGVSEWPAGRQGTIKLGSDEIDGCLAETPSGGTTLSWRARGSRNASPLLPSASGAVIYRAPIPKAAPVKVQAASTPGNFMFHRSAPVQMPVAPAMVSVKIADEPQISFRTGDIISAAVSRIDESGVVFESPQSTTTRALHTQIQSITLTPMESGVFIPQEKFDRLMTVPRLMKDDPPTHLLIAPTGDYLRGRLISLVGDKLTLAVGVENVELPSKSVAKIIWLHDRQWKTAGADGEVASAEVENAAAATFMVHAIRAGDRGLTFAPRGVTGGALSGVSDLLGSCKTEIDKIDQLLFGANIEARVREYRDDPWTLSLAQLPRVFAEAEGTLEAGKQSALVGQAAPHFVLRDIVGDEFVLSDQRPKVVVLDFWASWCGPCMQSMPEVEKIVDEFGQQHIALVAVNVQESATKAQAAIERLDISPTVVLDSVGSVSAAYGARAIPQTVIIDGDGNVTHVFVGGGKRQLDGLREALESLLVL